MTIINGNVNVIFYDSKVVVPSSSRYISQKYLSTLPPLHVAIEEHDNVMDENNRRESIESEKSVLIGMQETTYEYNDEYWDSI